MCSSDLLARTATEPQAPTTKFCLDVVRSDPQTGGKALDNDDEGLTMGLAGREVSQHVLQAIRDGARVRALPRRA